MKIKGDCKLSASVGVKSTMFSDVMASRFAPKFRSNVLLPFSVVYSEDGRSMLLRNVGLKKLNVTS
jgi:hypothetical protein